MKALTKNEFFKKLCMAAKQLNDFLDDVAETNNENERMKKELAERNGEEANNG